MVSQEGMEMNKKEGWGDPGAQELATLYNLCRLRKVGLDRWIEEEAGQMRKKYFGCKFVMGRGQAD